MCGRCDNIHSFMFIWQVRYFYSLFYLVRKYKRAQSDFLLSLLAQTRPVLKINACLRCPRVCGCCDNLARRLMLSLAAAQPRVFSGAARAAATQSLTIRARPSPSSLTHAALIDVVTCRPLCLPACGGVS